MMRDLLGERWEEMNSSSNRSSVSISLSKFRMRSHCKEGAGGRRRRPAISNNII
ncbi:hypothetical protein LINGRAHAP2_LOCUS9310 [Linum grandiflorum]